ncbi:MAG: PTS sugar transporter subunit IIC [Deltaproteobacteria bacterium]|jgi:mannose/fructose/N-acetylgalactosamine-specific phosphotransferase system component IIC|nr:PTS sugar transporter subunit IIC [Deltaproteobacteria bacterium]
MDPVSFRFLAAYVLAAVLNLDRQSLAQIMLARPLVTGLFMGQVLELEIVGLSLGFLAELLWLSSPPLGGHVAPNGGLAVSILLLTMALVEPLALFLPEKALIALGFLFLPPLAKLLTGVEKISRKVASQKEVHLLAITAQGQGQILFWANFKGLLVTLALGLAAVTILVPLLTALFALTIRFSPLPFWNLLSTIAPYLPLVGLTFYLGRVSKNLFFYYLMGLVFGSLVILA